MAKRFTDSEKWSDSWFRNLPAKYKLFWIYLLDSCDCAGGWKVDFWLARIFLNDNYDEAETLNLLNSDKKRIETFKEGTYWFIKEFIAYQYGTDLTSKSSVHRGIEKALTILEAKGLPKGYLTLKDKDKDKDKDILGKSENPFVKKPDLVHRPDCLSCDGSGYWNQAAGVRCNGWERPRRKAWTK